MKDSTTSRFKEGLAVRKNVLGADYVDTAFQNAEGDPISIELQEMVTEFGWGVV